jgi:hypothetical protein
VLDQLTGVKVLQVQPIEPPKRTSEEAGQLVAFACFAIPALLALFSLFVWLAAATLHDLFPAVPAPSYWQSMALVAGWHTVTVIARPRQWKWARR